MEEVDILYELNIVLFAIISMMNDGVRSDKRSKVKLYQHIIRSICIVKEEINP